MSVFLTVGGRYPNEKKTKFFFSGGIIPAQMYVCMYVCMSVCPSQTKISSFVSIITKIGNSASSNNSKTYCDQARSDRSTYEHRNSRKGCVLTTFQAKRENSDHFQVGHAAAPAPAPAQDVECEFQPKFNQKQPKVTEFEAFWPIVQSCQQPPPRRSHATFRCI